jgi:SAM-dependent methyltransferase
MRWQIRCLKDNIKGLLPFKNELRMVKRRIFGYHPSPDRGRVAIQEGLEMVRALSAHIDFASASVLEVGSGWEPLIPMLYSLAGTRSVILTDLTRLLHQSSMAAALEILRCNRDLIVEGLPVPGEVFDGFVRDGAGETLDDSLRRFRFRYMAPCDCRSTGLPDHSVDAVVSRAVLEHIRKEAILDIFKESARILKPEGVACHIVDNSDHWEHRDKRIGRINFLKYSDAVYRLTYFNKLNYQNRLRHSEYQKMLEEAGLEVVREQRTVDQRSLQALAHFQVAPRFKRFSHEDLATVDSFFVARRPCEQRKYSSGGTAAL